MMTGIPLGRWTRLLAALAMLGLALGLTLTTAGAASAATAAPSAPPVCSDATLHGTYTGAIAGTNPNGPFLLTGTALFNGDGTGTGTFTVTQNGQTVTFTDQLAYTIGPDCTGTLTGTRSTGQTVHYNITVTPTGQVLFLTSTDPGTTASGRFTRH